MTPLISIIMPTFNRARFLPDAVIAIVTQDYAHWELIVVDDGSTDDSPAILAAITKDIRQPVTLLSQVNAGPAAARNRGLAAATGDIIAFYDSDDLWLHDHLSTGLQVLSKYPDIAWVYFACRREVADTREVLQPSTFYSDDTPNALFDCATLIETNLFKLDNKKAALTQIASGIDSGLQNSLVRTQTLERFPVPEFRVGEDRLIVLQVLKAGVGMAFMDKVTVIYRVHDSNLSDTNPQSNEASKRISAMLALLESYERTSAVVSLTREEAAVLRKRVADDYFWKLAYALYLQSGNRRRAVLYMFRGLLKNPVKLKYWKTFLATLLHLNMAEKKAPPYPLTRRVADTLLARKRLLVIGDSHANIFRAPLLQQELASYSIAVCDIGGATVSGLANPNSTTQALPQFLATWRQVKPSVLLVLLGEFDTGFVIWWRAAKDGKSVDDMLSQALRNYCNFLEEIGTSQTTIVLSAPMPTIKDGQSWGDIANARREVTATQRERTALTCRFNNEVRDICDRLGIQFVSLDKECLDGNGLVRRFLLHKDPNNHHYDPEQYALLMLSKLREALP